MKKRILTIDIDSRHPYGNIALKKVAKYYIQKGYEVVKDIPMFKVAVDYVFVSCIFEKNRAKAAAWGKIKNAIVGGTGYDPTVQLPPEIEAEVIRDNIGFTTRGCPNKCFFCVVPQKEGGIRPVADIYDIWDRKAKKITLLDNNILALEDHFLKIAAQIKKENLQVDFNQGLDMRMLSPDVVNALQRLRIKRKRFAWDLDDDRSDLLHQLKEWFGSCFIYVLVGVLPFERDLEKLNIIRGTGHRAYVMRLEEIRLEAKYIALSRWVNRQGQFARHTFEEFLEADGRHEPAIIKKWISDDPTPSPKL